MELGRAVMGVLTNPVGQKLYLLRARFKSAKASSRRGNRRLLDVLIERHVEYCH